jgi:CRISPR system Cascade subunit CasB
VANSTDARPWAAIANFVSGRITRIQTAYLNPNRSDGKAWLAQLRKSGTEPGSSPTTWPLEFEGFPESLIGKSSPSPAERAAHLAFTLYATHQQSQLTGMHRPGSTFGLGQAVAKLDARQRQHSDSAPLGKLPSRFAALGTADDFDEISHYARQLITQLRAAELPLDYGILTNQLYRLQFPSLVTNVHLEWARGFAGITNNPTLTTTSTEKEQ